MKDSGIIAGVVLAGGRSMRMGRDKAGVMLGGRPLLAHALAILRPQVDVLAVNAGSTSPAGLDRGVRLVPDQRTDFPGPLAGIETALAFGRSAGASLVATIPIDAPFLPGDVVARLAAGLRPFDLAAVSETAEGLHPIVALWRPEALAAVSAALDDDVRAVRGLLARLPHAVVRFEDSGAFANVNTPEELERAEETFRGGT